VAPRLIGGTAGVTALVCFVMWTLFHPRARVLVGLGLADDGQLFWWGRYGSRSTGQATPECVDALGGLGVTTLAAAKGVNFALTADKHLCVAGVGGLVLFVFSPSGPSADRPCMAAGGGGRGTLHAGMCGASRRPRRCWASTVLAAT
jgi:hypothetical protein